MKNRTALLALIVAATIWGAGVALSKVSMQWLGPYWLITGRFVIAAVVLGLIGRKHLRSALNWKVALNGALGYGLVMVLLDIGIRETSVSHASILVGAVPVVIALVALGMGHARPVKTTWLGYGVALLGIVLVAGGGGGGATTAGDAIVLVSVLLGGVSTGLQPGLLADRDPAAVTAVQFVVGALLVLPLALLKSGLPHAPSTSAPVEAFVVLALIGTVIPFWLFAHGQKYVSSDLAGAFLNLEPLVGAVLGWTLFSNPVGFAQIAGSLAVIVGILLSVVHWESLRERFAVERPSAARFIAPRWWA